MDLQDLEVYRMAMDLGEDVWQAVMKWNWFARSTVGKQLMRAADSIAANLAEGYGRYHYRENRQFCYYARGSLAETRTWIRKAKNRRLIDDKASHAFDKLAVSLSVKLNNYIRSIGKTSRSVNCTEQRYEAAEGRN